MEKADELVEDEALRLEHLPDEILIHVSKWLPRVSDIVQLSRISRRFVPLASDEALFKSFLLHKWGLIPAKAMKKKQENQTWKELVLDSEILLGRWHGHANQDDWHDPDGYRMTLFIYSAKPNEEGELILTGKMKWDDLGEAETSVTGRVTRADPSVQAIAAQLLNSSHTQQMYDVKKLELKELQVLTDHNTIVPSTYQALLIRNCLIGNFEGTSDEHHYTCTGHFYVDLEEAIPDNDGKNTTYQTNSDVEFLRQGNERRELREAMIREFVPKGSYWIGGASDSFLNEHFIEMKAIDMSPEEVNSFGAVVTVRLPSTMPQGDDDEENSEDEAHWDHSTGIKQVMTPMQMVQITHFVKGPAEAERRVLFESKSCIYALSYDRETLTIMDCELVNGEIEPQLFPIRYIGRFVGADSDGLSLAYITSLQNPDQMVHGEVITFRGVAHLLRQY